MIYRINFFLAFLLCLNFSMAQVVTIGNGTQENNTPIALNFGYSYSQSIYLASEIGQTGNIYRIKYKGKSGLSLTNSEDWVVYIGHTTDTQFTPNNWISTSLMSERFNGAVSVVDDNVVVTLTSPFNYNGTDNLVIAIDENTPGSANSSNEILSTAVSTPRSILFRNDNTNPDPTSITSNTISQNSVPNIDLDFNATVCNTPTNLSVNNIKLDSAKLVWTPGGSETNWKIEYGPSGFTQGNGTTITGVTTNPYDLVGLTHSTSYDFYIQADCGSGESGWGGPFSFTTLCPPFTIPYFEGFENGYTHGEDISGCLDQQVMIGSQKFKAKNKIINPSPLHIPRTGDWNAYLYSLNETWLFIPVELTAGISYTVQSYARYSNTGGSNISIKYGTMNNATAMTNIIVNDITLTNLDYQKMRGDFIPMLSGTYYVGFYGQATSFYFGYLSIDDIKIIETPSCLEPDDLTVSNILATSVNLGWTELGTATTWNIEYGPSGFTQGNGTTITGVTINPNNLTELTLTGLTANTSYDFYVQSDCGGNDFSPWSGVQTFTTACSALTSFPFLEDFENITAGQPNCWGIAGTTNTDNYHWYSYVNGHQGRGLRFNCYNNVNGRTSELTTQIFDLSSLANAVLKFDFKNPTGGNFEVLISTDGGTNYSSLENNLIGQTTWLEKSYDITSYIGSNVKIQFFGTSNYGNGDAYVYLDNVKIEGTNTISCVEPVNLTVVDITNNSVNLGWTAIGSETNWNIEYGISGFTQGNGTTIGLDTSSYNLAGLTESTFYDFYVQADCGTDSSTWVGPFNFGTQTNSLWESEILENSITYYPNPVQDNLTILTSQVITGVSLINILGEELYNQKEINKKSVKIDMAQYQKGVYFVRVNNKTNFGTIKVVKK